MANSDITLANSKKQHHRVLVCENCNYEIDISICNCDKGNSHVIMADSGDCDLCTTELDDL